jgi:hypothetical protein
VFAGLRLLLVDDLDTTGAEVFREIAEQYPAIKLGLVSDEFLTILGPIRNGLSLSDMPVESDADAIAKFNQMEAELLSLDLDEWIPDSLDHLVRIISPRTLSISTLTPDLTGSFVNPERLRSLSIAMASEMVDLSALKSFSGLQELMVMLSDSVMNIAALGNLRQLREIRLIGEPIDSVEFAALVRLKNIRWLGLPANTSQEQFAEVVSSHPDLMGLELIGCDRISDLSPLRRLRELEYLTVLATDWDDVDYESMRSLTSLRYLMLPEEVFDDTLGVVDTLQQALPQTVIVQGTQGIHLCLATGWIITLIPAAAIGYLVSRRKGRRATSPGC